MPDSLSFDDLIPKPTVAPGADAAPAPLSFDDLVPQKPSMLDRAKDFVKGAGSDVVEDVKNAGRRAYEGAQESTSDFTTPIDTESWTPHPSGLAGELLDPFAHSIGVAGATAARAVKTGMDLVSPAFGGASGLIENPVGKPGAAAVRAIADKIAPNSAATEMTPGEFAGDVVNAAAPALGADHATPAPRIPTAADGVLTNIAEGKPVDTPPEQPAAHAEQPQVDAPQPQVSTASGPHTPAFDMQTGNYGVRGADGQYVAPPSFPKPEQAEAEAARLNATAPQPVATPESAPPVAAPSPAPTPAPNLSRQMDIAGEPHTINLPDENHAALFDYGQGLERAEAGSPDEALRPNDIYARFRPWVHDDFADKNDVNDLARDYLDSIVETRNMDRDPDGSVNAGVVVDPSLEANYVRQYGHRSNMAAAADNSGYTMLDPSDIQRDPDRFQYKEADENGVTGALKGVQKWEPDLASPITAWRDNDGNTFVVNGHQRTDLALRAQEAGQDNVQVPARVYNEADGFTPEYMRTLGAAQNIAEGSGTAIDAAKIMRSASAMPEDMRLPELPPRSQLVKDAQGLTKLSDQAFGMVTNEIVPPEYAAEVGRRISDPTEQMAALDALAKGNPANVSQARFMVDDILNSGFLKGDQTSLFGNEQLAQSLIGERSRILDNSQRTLRRNRTVFNAAVTGEDTLAGAGNVLDREGNMKGKSDNEQLIEHLAGATRKGPLSDALSDAARDLAAGKPIAAVTSRFLGRARQIIEAERSPRPVEARPDIGGDGYARPTEEDGQSGLGFAEPKIDKTDQGDQFVLPGGERSATQAAAARSPMISEKVPQKPADEGLFAPKEKPGQLDMFGTPLPKGFSEEAADGARDLFNKAATAVENGRGPLKHPANLIRTIGRVASDSVLGRAVRRIVSPGTFDDTARLAARGIRQVFGQMYVRDLQTAHALRGAVDTLDKMSPEERTQFAIAMDEGKKQSTPELQKIADDVTAQTKAATARLQSLGILDDAKENYLGRIWKPRGTTADASTPAKVLAALTSKRPLTGGKSFLKQRIYDTYRDAIESGLEPQFENPITTQLVKLSEMNRFYAGTLVARAAKESGLAKFFTHPGDVPEGFMKLEGPEFERNAMKIKDGDDESMVPRGNWYAPEGYARVMNNYVSKGLDGTDLAEPAKMLRAASNAMNSFQLGLSFFHPVFTSIDGQISRVGIGIDQIMRGQFGKGASSVGQGMLPLNWRGNFVDGDKLLKAVLDPDNAPPEMRRIVDAFGVAGGRAFMQRVLRPTDEGAIQVWKKGAFGRAIQEANKKYPDSPIKAALNVAGRALETTSAPVMDYIVPRQKLGVFSRLASDWLQSHPDATNTEFVAAMQDRWESVDNRLGQMVYDNLFWNKTLKDIAFITTRSVGWNMGSFREIGGGAADFGKFALDGLGGRKPEWTHRMSYLLALPAVTGMYGAMLQYMFTGQGPQEMKDYFYPKTGLKRTDGSADRVSVPSYMKDIFAYANNPGQTLMNKANPFLSFLGELESGKDYYGDLIANKDDPAYKQVEDVMKFAATNFLPFSIQGTKRLFQERPGPSAALGMFGVTPAPGYITNPLASKKWEDREHRAAVTKTRKHEARENNIQPLKPMDPQNP